MLQNHLHNQSFDINAANGNMTLRRLLDFSQHKPPANKKIKFNYR